MTLAVSNSPSEHHRMLTSEEAIPLIAREAELMGIPTLAETDIVQIVDIALRSGARRVEVCMSKWWFSGSAPPPGPGVSMIELEYGRDGWQLGG